MTGRIDISSWRDVALFSGMDDAELAAVVKRLSRKFIRHFDNGEVIFRTGETPDSCFIIINGEVEIRVGGVRIGNCRAGQLLGERALVENSPRSADATAVRPGLLMELQRAVFEDLLRESHTFARNVVKVLAQKLRWSVSDAVRSQSTEDRYFRILSNHLSAAALDYLVADSVGLEVPRMLDNAVVMFADIEDYARLTTHITDPVELADCLSDYLGGMTDLVHRHGGVINSFLGDGILAYWGFPEFAENTPLAALECALEMRRTAGRFRLGRGQIVSRIGLAAGEVFCGVVGKPPVQRFTILGSVVNLAARLEQANKETGTSVLATREPFSGAAHKLSSSSLRGFSPAEEYDVRVKGFTDEVDCLGLRFNPTS